MNSLRHFDMTLGQGISQFKHLYLHRTAQHNTTWIYIHVLSRIQTHNSSVPEIWYICLRLHDHWGRKF